MIYAKCKVTPESIVSLKENEIFVFGSNLAGIHGAGAARQALVWGAEYGKGLGAYGQTYALPTKDESIITLPVNDIRRYVNCLESYVVNSPDYHFLITKVGCGLAGYDIEDIAPLFAYFIDIENVSLPVEFINYHNAITDQQIEEIAIDNHQKGWEHIYVRGKLGYPREGRYPSDFWKEIDMWKKGFMAALD